MDLKRKFSKKLNYEFKNTALLEEALTHRSVGARNNERLEFLGDSILNFIVSTEIFHSRPDFREGKLTRLRASLVCGTMLAEVAREAELGDLIKLGTGELKSGGFDRSSILADVVEAIIGAVYLDGGLGAATDAVHCLFGDRLVKLPSEEPGKDPKTALQEYLQSRQLTLPRYELLQTLGEAHARRFVVSCEVPDIGIELQAEGTSIRKAEQQAAADTLEKISVANDN